MSRALIISALFLLCMSNPSNASEDAASFFRNDKRPVSSSVASMVAASAERQLGSQWVNTALKLAHVESRFNCGAVGPKTRGGRPRGVMQVMPGSARALGYDPARLNECQHGIDAGIAHMRSCLNAGVRTHDQMARCHVAGAYGWNRRLNRKAERYKQAYVRLASR